MTILARDPATATKVAKAIACGSADLRAFPVGDWDVVLNATPVGSRSFGDALPIPADSLEPEMTVFDMVYDPLETPLLTRRPREGLHHHRRSAHARGPGGGAVRDLDRQRWLPPR